MTRDLTEDEADEVACCSPAHSNHDGSYCCPHCLKSSKHSGVRGVYPVAVKCPNPECGREFAAWRDTVEVFQSAPLPDGGQVPTPPATPIGGLE